MPIKRSLLKREARRELAAARPNAMLMTLFYFLLTTGVSTVVEIFVDNPFLKMEELMQAGLELRQALSVALSGTGSMALFLTILIAIYSLVVDFGYTNWTMKASRGVYGERGDLISGFSMAGQVLLLYLELGVFCFLWYLAFFAPVIFVLLFLGPMAEILSVPLVLVALVLFVMRILHYSMAPLCLIDDPEAGGMAAIRRSRDMMEGNCAVFFNLMFSFFGWYLLLALEVVLAEGAMIAIVNGRELMAAYMAGDLLALIDSINVGMSSNWTVLVVNLVVLPLNLWLTPYIAITHARYYDLLQTRELGSIYV